MAYKLRSKKTKAGKRKMYKKRGVRKGARKILVNNALQPIPQRYIAKHKYVANVTTDANGNYTFNLNSTFDPDRTGGGHQPYGRDQLAALYNRYRVISASWRIFAQNSTVPIQVAAIATNEVTTYTNMGSIVEAPRSKFIIQMPGAAATVLKGHVSLPSLVGRSRVEYMGSDRYQADVNADPTEQCILSVFAADSSGAYLVGQKLFVEIMYCVEWFDVRTLAQS